MFPYDALFDASAPVAPVDRRQRRRPCCAARWGCLRGSRSASSRWALRVNPSSGNLHPTESYLIRDGRVHHYAPREHALEERSALSPAAWADSAGSNPGFLVALTSIHWREAWKYGERAFRYCQHDAGHAIAALRFAAALLGWRLALLPRWSDAHIAAVAGVDRDADFAGAEREEPECIAAVTPGDVQPWLDADPDALVEAARGSVWAGRANALSPARVDWPIIDEVALATRRVPRIDDRSCGEPRHRTAQAPWGPRGQARPRGRDNVRATTESGVPARAIILQRRSAVAFDGRSTLPRAAFLSMLARTGPPPRLAALRRAGPVHHGTRSTGHRTFICCSSSIAWTASRQASTRICAIRRCCPSGGRRCARNSSGSP